MGGNAEVSAKRYVREERMTLTEKKMKNPMYMNIVYCVAKLLFAMLTCCELFYFSAFMTDAALMSAGIVAMVLSVTSVIDFIVSFFLGTILQASRLPWGKYRSWLLISPPIVTVFHIFMFSKVSDDEMVSAVVIIIGFVISHIVWSVAEAAWNSMPLVMTEDQGQRASLSVWGGRGSMANTLLFGFIGMPIVMAISGLFKGNMVLGYCGLGVILCILYWVGFWWLFFATKGCEETAADRKAAGKSEVKQKSNLGAALKSAVTNPNLLAMMVGVACTYCNAMIGSAANFYLFSYSFEVGAIAMMGTFISINSLSKLIGSFLMPVYMKIFKGSKRACYLFGFAALAVVYLIAYVANLGAVGTMALILIASFLSATIMSMQLGLYFDCATYSEWKTGKDVKGFVMSLTVMPIKIGIVVKNFIWSAVLVGISYSATATDTSAYDHAFRFAYFLIPVIISVVAIAVNLLLYRLNESKVAQMQKEIDARKAAAAVE